MTKVLSHSQNYFRDSGYVRKLVAKAEITKDDLVVEIGPGKGIITEALLQRTDKVIAVEVDTKLYEQLKEKFTGEPRLEIVCADFLEWELPNSPYKVFANIPFNMTAEMMVRLFGETDPPQVAYLVMQDKAAERYLGAPIALDTQTSILLKNEYEVLVIAEINSTEFEPRPRVGTVLVKFGRRSDPLVPVENRQLFRDFVVYGYNQWKPTVLEAFEKIFNHLQRQRLQKMVGVKSKPRELKVEQWVALFATYIQYVSEEKKALVAGAESRLKAQQSKLQKIHKTR